jgi:uncharacterized protein YabE (DUF348 family)
MAGFATHPSAALAAGTSPAPAGIASAAPASASHYAVTFDANGVVTQHATDAQTVGDFLHERNVTIGANDYLTPAANVPLSDGLVITYRAAVNVTIETANRKLTAVTTASDVGSLLEEQHITLGASDRVEPSLSDPVPANGVVRVARVLTWERNERRAIAEQTIHRLDFSMTPGTSRTISSGTPGERDVMVRFVQRDGGNVRSSVIASHVVRKPRPRVIAEGAGEYAAFEHFEENGIQRTAYIAQSAMQMVATAYTAACGGCSGITAIGRPAGHGIVAVDPSVIPLGTRLYIPGYGPAIAGDTGGAIHGLRIDLGFNSLRDAMLFGRRQVTVYRLK